MIISKPITDFPEDSEHLIPIFCDLRRYCSNSLNDPVKYVMNTDLSYDDVVKLLECTLPMCRFIIFSTYYLIYDLSDLFISTDNRLIDYAINSQNSNFLIWLYENGIKVSMDLLHMKWDVQCDVRWNMLELYIFLADRGQHISKNDIILMPPNILEWWLDKYSEHIDISNKNINQLICNYEANKTFELLFRYGSTLSDETYEIYTSCHCIDALPYLINMLMEHNKHMKFFNTTIVIDIYRMDRNLFKKLITYQNDAINTDFLLGLSIQKEDIELFKLFMNLYPKYDYTYTVDNIINLKTSRWDLTTWLRYCRTFDIEFVYNSQSDMTNIYVKNWFKEHILNNQIENLFSSEKYEQLFPVEKIDVDNV